MPTTSLPGGGQVWRLRDRRGQLARFAAWLAATALFLWCWHLISAQTTWFFVWDAPRIAGDILTRAMPPRWSYINELWRPLWDTINIATLGTLLALVLAVPVAFLAARNTTPSVSFVR
ncbi:MAG TPA: phosphonate ABC transporter, permease protein PhnE, partial [Paracoccaceae bacterium]|nr:phosphonate ABC transporter, permease protein PhnE [Paracoccaceae bacterium]